MDPHERIHHYAGRDIAVSYDPRRCIHAAECLRGLPSVFASDRRPWITPDGALPNEVAAVIERCPSGALHYSRLDGGVEELPDDPTVIVPIHNGPLYVRGDVQLRAPDGSWEVRDTRLALCRCGASAHKPFCDNSHRRIHFDDGSVDGATERVHAGE